jgi:deazaflavin-dependent oxidoreductase (nitroreductase family)
MEREAGTLRRIRRLIFRLPLLLDGTLGRGLQRMLTGATGVEWIVLDTVGRRSGRPHTVVLDVVGRDRARDIYYVQPADGRRSAWVHNVIAQPAVTARVGDHRVCARVRDASGAEGAEVVLRFLRAHPWYGRVVAWFVGYVERIDRADDALRHDLTATPVFAIEVLSPSAP